MQDWWEWILFFMLTVYVVWRTAQLWQLFRLGKLVMPWRAGEHHRDLGQIKSCYFVGTAWVVLIAYLVHHKSAWWQQIAVLLSSLATN